MRVSVIMPCHNAGPWIASALRSIAQQTCPACEIVVIDDNSTDDSVAQIETSGVPAKVLRVNVRNAAASRNAGIEVASGDWVALLDADDVWYPDHLARAAQLLGPTEDVAFMSNHDWISIEGAPIPIPESLACKLTTPRSGMSVNDFFQMAIGGFHFGHSTVLYRRDRLLQVGMFDITQKRRHDLDLWLRMIAGCTWTYDTVKQAGYREGTPGSISKALMDCDYYELRAFVKNLSNSDCPQFRQLLARQARRAMGIAFVDGSEDQYARIRLLAWPHLPWTLKLFYACGADFPRFMRAMIKMKRFVVQSAASSPAPGH